MRAGDTLRRRAGGNKANVPATSDILDDKNMKEGEKREKEIAMSRIGICKAQSIGFWALHRSRFSSR